MSAKYLVKGIKLLIFCVLAAGANYLLNTLSVFILKLPLFLDTVFTCALAFAAGPVPGIAAAALTTVVISFRDGSTRLFVLCSITEVLLICFLKPKARQNRAGGIGRFYPEAASLVNTFAALLFLYIAACVVVSILGGIIDFILYDLMLKNKLHYSPEDTFKVGLLRSSLPILPANILSRLPINVVDRFITIFGGFSISLMGKRIGSYHQEGKIHH
ncbi:MAG: hypothetical protein LBJ31_08745 [Treponema sp.]|jgi:hypothetical protein|nr:hypothetical protein [Treponema sp.]